MQDQEPVDLEQLDIQERFGSEEALREQQERERRALQKQVRPEEPTGLEVRWTVGERREIARGQLARGLLLILALTIAGVLIFIGFGTISGTVLTDSIFPSIVALAGTALGFYFGAETRGGGASNGESQSGGTGGAPPR